MQISLLARVACLSACLLLSPLPASAAVYKCTIQGEVRYQDSPCPGQPGQAPHIEDPAPAPTPVPADAVAAGGQGAPAVAGEAEDAAATPAPMPADDAPLDAIGQLFFAHRSALEEQRDLQRQYRAEVRRLAAAQEGKAETEQSAWERRELERTWRERQLAAAERAQRLQAQLRAACPNGTLMQRGRPACR